MGSMLVCQKQLNKILGTDIDVEDWLDNLAKPEAFPLAEIPSMEAEGATTTEKEGCKASPCFTSKERIWNWSFESIQYLELIDFA